MNGIDDGCRHFSCSGLAAEVGRVKTLISRHPFNRLHETLGYRLLTQVLKKHHRRPEGAIGLATPLPMMSKAEPWIGSNMDGKVRSGLILPVGAMPSEPASAAARSDRMSACRLVATMVSIVCGCITIRMVIASTSILSQVTSLNSCATWAAISSHITMA